MRSWISSLLLPIAAVLLSGCSEPVEQSPDPAAESKPLVVAVNNPLYYFAHRMAGDSVELRLLAPVEGDPAQWSPGAGEALQLQQADLVLLNGAGYSSWLDKVSLSSARLVVTSEAAKESWIELAGTVTHSHGPEGEHAHGGYAFTTWMDFSLAEEQARSVAEALLHVKPDLEADLPERLDALLADLAALDAGFKVEGKRLAGRQLIYSHPVYQYFERAYGMTGTSLHWEPDRMPDQEAWAELEREQTPGALFIWEGEPNAAIAERLSSMGMEQVVIDPAGNRGEHDWLIVQRQSLARLAAVSGG